jgi:hypothetical protein
MSRQVTVNITTAVTVVFDDDTEVQDAVNTFVENLAYEFTENPSYDGVIVETQIVEHSIGAVTKV